MAATAHEEPVQRDKVSARLDDWIAQPLYGDGNSREFAMERALDYIAHEPGRHIGIYKLVAIVRGTIVTAVEELDDEPSDQAEK